MSLCLLRVSLSGSLTASGQGSLTTIGEFLNISALDPLLPTFLIATLCLCALSVITYYSLALAWEVFWASRRSPSPLDPSAEVVLTTAIDDDDVNHTTPDSAIGHRRKSEPALPGGSHPSAYRPVDSCYYYASSPYSPQTSPIMLPLVPLMPYILKPTATPPQPIDLNSATTTPFLIYQTSIPPLVGVPRHFNSGAGQ